MTTEEIIAAFREIQSTAQTEAAKLDSYQDGNRETTAVLDSIVWIAADAIGQLEGSNEG